MLDSRRKKYIDSELLWSDRRSWSGPMVLLGHPQSCQLCNLMGSSLPPSFMKEKCQTMPLYSGEPNSVKNHLDWGQDCISHTVSFRETISSIWFLGIWGLDSNRGDVSYCRWLTSLLCPRRINSRNIHIKMLGNDYFWMVGLLTIVVNFILFHTQ